MSSNNSSKPSGVDPKIQQETDKIRAKSTTAYRPPINPYALQGAQNFNPYALQGFNVYQSSNGASFDPYGQSSIRF